MSEPLSERELDVLRLLRTDLSGPDIARELMVSLNTLRTHTKNIYTKLGVNNRRAAVRGLRNSICSSNPSNTTPLAGLSNHLPGLFCVPHSLPIEKSPHQSPHVVMPVSPHERVSSDQKGNAMQPTWRCIHRRNMNEAQHE